MYPKFREMIYWIRNVSFQDFSLSLSKSLEALLMYSISVQNTLSSKGADSFDSSFI